MNASWNANLISYLSTQKTSLPFHSLDGLLDSTSYKIAIISGSAQEDYFKLSADPVKQKAWTERIEPYLNYFGQYSGTPKSRFNEARFNESHDLVNKSQLHTSYFTIYSPSI